MPLLTYLIDKGADILPDGYLRRSGPAGPFNSPMYQSPLEPVGAPELYPPEFETRLFLPIQMTVVLQQALDCVDEALNGCSATEGLSAQAEATFYANLLGGAADMLKASMRAASAQPCAEASSESASWSDASSQVEMLEGLISECDEHVRQSLALPPATSAFIEAELFKNPARPAAEAPVARVRSRSEMLFTDAAADESAADISARRRRAGEGLRDLGFLRAA